MSCAVPVSEPTRTIEPSPSPDLAPTDTPVAATSTTTPTVPPASDALVEAAVGNLSNTLHPYPDAAAYNQAWADAAALIWGGADGGGALLAFDWETLEYRPAMAAQLPSISADGRTFTFKLRDDLKWSDGSPITFDDFQFAFDQASREENRYVQADLLQEVASLRTLASDTRGLEITLKSTRPRDVALAIVNIITPVPKHVWFGRSWTDAATNPEILNPSVVLGPFKAQEFRVGERAVFVALDTYFAGQARVPRVEVVANQQPSIEPLKNGSANWVRGLQPAQFQAATATPNIQVKVWAAANATYRTLEFNLARPFLSDKRVRQALASAVNRSDLIDVAEDGQAVPQYSFVQPTNSRWVNAAVTRYDYDLTKAQQLLEEAGYRRQNALLVGKDRKPVKLQVVYPSSSPSRARIGTYLQQQYKQLGIEVELKALEFNTYTEQVQNRRDFDVSLASYGGGSIDPELGPKSQLITNGPQNVTGYTNPQVDELFKQAGTTVDSNMRKQLYDQIQVLVSGDVPSHYLYALKSIDAFSHKVHGVFAHKGDRLDANDALLNWSVDP